MEQITIKEIAKLCGVGVSTVSRAINNHQDINPETKQMILDTINKYHYVPNNSARNLKRVDSNAIALLIKGIVNPFFNDMIQIFEREINQKKYSFILQHVDDSEDEIDVAIQLEKEKRLKGIVFLGGLTYHTEEKLDQLSVPFVSCTVDISDMSREIASISVDNVRESERMVDYLIGIGHKKIALLTARRSDRSIGKKRQEGYERALKKNGLPIDENLISWTIDGMETYSMQAGYEQTKRLLASGVEFSCIFAISDSMAIGACKALFDAGKRVPEDYSVAGFDGLAISQFYEPSITTIKQPRAEMAEAATRLLFDRMEEKSVEMRQIFEAELIIGQSTRSME